ncbi:hypothetical protein GPALN_004561 [Globodera pallida]|uniref:Secreted protein n=1 Tax=Globodera pallida TaxID=36090 RepID=A0A183C5I1_GLOPA|nr:hypothetical protein GPALN_004560 [Globodera pallida]KAI3410459.1 hypothetical protein GPALN_004561 [Globodera pallida]
MNAQKTIIVAALVIAVAMLSMEVPSVDAQCCVPNGAGVCESRGCCDNCLPLGSGCTCINGANKTPNARNAVEAAAAAADGTAAGSK